MANGRLSFKNALIGLEMSLVFLIFAFDMDSEKVSNHIEISFGEFLHRKGLRKTPERFVILKKISQIADHFYIDELRRMIENDGYHISLATVYNTMQLLMEFGYVRRHQFEGQPAQFERVGDNMQGNHHHLICRNCGKIKEVKDPGLLKTINEKHYQSFTPAYFSLYVYGICSACQRKKRRKSKSL